MWVYDGEEWYQEGNEPESGKSTTVPNDPWPAEQFYPELQIIEVPLIRERLPEPPPLMIIP